jgi:uncharacterized protein YprB with RNaseH-like and TPR domain
MHQNRCKAHGHTYASHPQCYVKEQQYQERIGFLDIESNHLKANFGHVISYCIIDNFGKTWGRVLSPKEVRDWNILDKKLMQEFSNNVNEFDKLVVYYGRDYRMDIPFLRSRCLKHGVDFPLYKSIKVTDLYDICKSKLSLHSCRLQNVCDFLGIPSKTHKLDVDLWVRANKGDPESLKHIWEHNVEDCMSTKSAYERLAPYVANRNTSI